MEIFNKIKIILITKEKIKFIFLLVYAFINSLLELLSIGLLIPIIISLFSKESTSFFLNIDFLKSDNLTIYENLRFLVSIFLVTIIIKNIFYFFFNYKLFSFLFIIKKRIISKLYEQYIFQSYDFYFTKKSSEILRNVRLPNNFAQLISAILFLILEILLVLILVLFLISINPQITFFILFAFLIIGYLMYIIWRKKIYNWGKDAQLIEANINKKVSENIFSVKEIILYAKQKFFLNNFVEKTIEYIKIVFKLEILQQLPKIIVELLVAVIIFALIFYLTIKQISHEKLLLTLGSFSIISIRLMPSISRILTFIQKIKYFSPSVEILSDEIEKTKFYKQEKKNDNDINFKFNSIDIKNLNFAYDKKNKVFKNNINLKITKGEMIGIFGKSGSGKSTLVNLITGLILPNEGQIESDGFNLHENLLSWQKKIAYVPQNINLIDENIARNIAFGEDYNDLKKEEIVKAAKEAQVHEYISKSQNEYKTNVGEHGILVSGGQKQRIGLARAFYRKPELIIFDEATAALDKETENEIINLIINHKKNKIIILISHDLNLLKKCDKIFSIETNNFLT